MQPINFNQINTFLTEWKADISKQASDMLVKAQCKTEAAAVRTFLSSFLNHQEPKGVTAFLREKITPIMKPETPEDYETVENMAKSWKKPTNPYGILTFLKNDFSKDISQRRSELPDAYVVPSEETTPAPSPKPASPFSSVSQVVGTAIEKAVVDNRQPPGCCKLA